MAPQEGFYTKVYLDLFDQTEVGGVVGGFERGTGGLEVGRADENLVRAASRNAFERTCALVREPVRTGDAGAAQQGELLGCRPAGWGGPGRVHPPRQFSFQRRRSAARRAAALRAFDRGGRLVQPPG